MKLLKSLQVKYYRRSFGEACIKIRSVKGEFTSSASNFVVVSQTYSKDIDMFLLAAKSFARYLPPKRFIIVDDGLTPEEQELISEQLGDVEFRPRMQVPNLVCPSGGCWERLLTVADCAETDYVVQLDSDTVTIRPPSQVIAAIASMSAFTLSTKQGREVISAEKASAFAETIVGEHVQLLAERALVKVAPDTYYIRGCAGFIGMPKNGIGRATIENFSQSMERALSASVWARWGSEQFASNYCVASIPNVVALDFEKYPYWETGQDIGCAEFIHFIGTDRFTGPMYQKISSAAIRELL